MSYREDPMTPAETAAVKALADRLTEACEAGRITCPLCKELVRKTGTDAAGETLWGCGCKGAAR